MEKTINLLSITILIVGLFIPVHYPLKHNIKEKIYEL